MARMSDAAASPGNDSLTQTVRKKYYDDRGGLQPTCIFMRGLGEPSGGSNQLLLPVKLAQESTHPPRQLR